jgi:hypothetical protein
MLASRWKYQQNISIQILSQMLRCMLRPRQGVIDHQKTPRTPKVLLQFRALDTDDRFSSCIALLSLVRLGQ